MWATNNAENVVIPMALLLVCQDTGCLYLMGRFWEIIFEKMLFSLIMVPIWVRMATHTSAVVSLFPAFSLWAVCSILPLGMAKLDSQCCLSTQLFALPEPSTTSVFVQSTRRHSHFAGSAGRPASQSVRVPAGRVHKATIARTSVEEVGGCVGQEL